MHVHHAVVCVGGNFCMYTNSLLHFYNLTINTSYISLPYGPGRMGMHVFWSFGRDVSHRYIPYGFLNMGLFHNEGGMHRHI